LERLLTIGGLFALAGMYEIGGGYLVWGWMREHKPIAWALIGALVLAANGVVAALQPISEFGRVYAAYGGIFIALSLGWGIIVDGFRPDRWDLLGALICVVGVVMMVARPGVRALLGKHELQPGDHQHGSQRPAYAVVLEVPGS
jgi:small multidrug resistance family-3 protein